MQKLKKLKYNKKHCDVLLHVCIDSSHLCLIFSFQFFYLLFQRSANLKISQT